MDVCSDWDFTGNTVNVARICNFRMSGVDGLTVSGNTFFMLNYSSGLALRADKTYNVWIGKSNQLHLHDSSLFEAGLASIRLDDVQNPSITGVQCVWPGQNVLFDAIVINGGTPKGIIDGCVFANGTRAAIGLRGGDVSRLKIGVNGYTWNANAASNMIGTAMTNANCFRSDVDRTLADTVAVVTGVPLIRDFSVGTNLYDSYTSSNRVTARDQKGTFSGIGAAARRSMAISATAAVITISDFQGSLAYSGLIEVRPGRQRSLRRRCRPTCCTLSARTRAAQPCRR